MSNYINKILWISNFLVCQWEATWLHCINSSFRENRGTESIKKYGWESNMGKKLNTWVTDFQKKSTWRCVQIKTWCPSGVYAAVKHTVPELSMKVIGYKWLVPRVEFRYLRCTGCEIMSSTGIAVVQTWFAFQIHYLQFISSHSVNLYLVVAVGW